MRVSTLGRTHSRYGTSGPSYCRLRMEQDRLKHKATGSPEALAASTQPRCLWGRTAEVTDRPPTGDTPLKPRDPPSSRSDGVTHPGDQRQPQLLLFSDSSGTSYPSGQFCPKR